MRHEYNYYNVTKKQKFKKKMVKNVELISKSKRFDVPVELGGVNGLGPVSNRAGETVHLCRKDPSENSMDAYGYHPCM